MFPERVLVDRWKKFLLYKMGEKKLAATSEFFTFPELFKIQHHF